VPASTCDGAGSCLAGAPVSCFPFLCGSQRVPRSLRERRRLRRRPELP
jgi:hypothetical protein